MGRAAVRAESVPVSLSVSGVNGELIVVDDLPGAFAAHVISAYEGRPDELFGFALCGGDTARPCYKQLAADSADTIDWLSVNIYWGDERCVPPDHPDSNQLLGRQALLERVGVANAVYPMSCEEGPDAYQLRLGEIGKLDVIHLGLGAGWPHRLALSRLTRPRRRSRAAGGPQRGPVGPPPLCPHDAHLLGDRPLAAGRLHRRRRPPCAPRWNRSWTAPTCRPGE